MLKNISLWKQEYKKKNYLKGWHKILSYYLKSPKRSHLKTTIIILNIIQKCLEWLSISDNNDHKGSGGGVNVGNWTLPFAQHNPGVSLGNFNALQ